MCLRQKSRHDARGDEPPNGGGRSCSLQGSPGKLPGQFCILALETVGGCWYHPHLKAVSNCCATRREELSLRRRIRRQVHGHVAVRPARDIGPTIAECVRGPPPPNPSRWCMHHPILQCTGKFSGVTEDPREPKATGHRRRGRRADGQPGTRGGTRRPLLRARGKRKPPGCSRRMLAVARLIPEPRLNRKHARHEISIGNL